MEGEPLRCRAAQHNHVKKVSSRSVCARCASLCAMPLAALAALDVLPNTRLGEQLASLFVAQVAKVSAHLAIGVCQVMWSALDVVTVG